MSAGESAYDVARRQREKAERLQRSAALWEKGAEGEVAVARALEALPEGWVALHDLAWPGRERANIDHVVIGPGGVFVVDAKNWSGRVEVRDDVLLQNGRRREPTVISAAEAAIAMQGVVPPPACCMGVLCFVRDEALVGSARDVMVCSTSNLTTMLTSRPHVLSAEDVLRCADALRELAGRRPGRAPRPTASMVAAPSRRAAKRRPGHPIAALVTGFALVALALGGGLEKVGDGLSQLIVPDTQVSPTPVKRDKQDVPLDKKRERQKKQR
jgi:hypothetical protein